MVEACSAERNPLYNQCPQVAKWNQEKGIDPLRMVGEQPCPIRLRQCKSDWLYFLFFHVVSEVLFSQWFVWLQYKGGVNNRISNGNMRFYPFCSCSRVCSTNNGVMFCQDSLEVGLNYQYNFNNRRVQQIVWIVQQSIRIANLLTTRVIYSGGLYITQNRHSTQSQFKRPVIRTIRSIVRQRFTKKHYSIKVWDECER